jgi:hypothetical protein
MEKPHSLYDIIKGLGIGVESGAHVALEDSAVIMLIECAMGDAELFFI